RGRVKQATTPATAHRVARRRDFAKLLQRREPRRCRILAALEPLLDADGEVTTNLFVEVVVVRPHAYSLPADAGFMTRPIASTSCDHRSRSRDSCAFPAAVSS